MTSLTKIAISGAPAVCLAWALVLLPCCESEPGSPSGLGESFAYGLFDLEDEDGGFAGPGDLETFYLGNTGFFGNRDERNVSEDDAQLNPSSDITPDDPNVKVAFALILWGQLRMGEEVSGWSDFSGTISSNGAALRILNIMRLDSVDGDRVLPRTDPHAITFVSHTREHHDGLLLKLLVRTGGSQPAVLHIQVGAHTQTYVLADFAEGMTDVTELDDQGNELLVVGAPAPPPNCRYGFVLGFWRQLTERGGIFGGRSVGADGQPQGQVAGIWGRRKRNGEQRMFGIYVNEDGELKGIIRSQYVPSSAGQGNADVARSGGRWAGTWVSKNGEHRGKLGGLYGAIGTGHGYLRGRWAEKACEW